MKTKTPLRIWSVIHHHRFGTDAYVVRHHRQPSESQVVKALYLDYEPERDDEWLEVSELSEITLIQVKARKK